MRPKVVALMGPTASGKTDISIDLAEQFDGEILSVDSALVYRHLDIGSAKPTLEERRGISHHLMDVREPWQPYSAAEFAEDAHAAIQGIVDRGKLPILVGGTGLYFQALLEGLGAMPAASAEVRESLTARAQVEGWESLHNDLAKVDPEASQRIHSTDAQRIQRALEVFVLTGRPISELQREGREAKDERYESLKIIVAPPERVTLHQRIETRLDAMVSAGFLDEVRSLREMPELAFHANPLELPAIRAVGYRQAWLHLAGAYNFDEFRMRAIAATRQLAKRQFTWLRGEQNVSWFNPATSRDHLIATVAEFVI